MLAMSVDHELFKKAYSDYSNLDGGPLTIEDTSYRNDFAYYGYFDSEWCYKHSGEYFEPVAKATDFRCNDVTGADWSGNFLNWATMTRMDIVRRVLYGGKRSTDGTDKTVLERAYLPADAHSFAKVYRGSDARDFTPYTAPVSLCNTSHLNSPSSVETSPNATTAPWLRVASGDFRQWALKGEDTGQCQYSGDDHPALEDKEVDLKVFVKACDAEASSSERCKAYTDGTDTYYKPVGLLQKYETNIRFGLVSGSYRSNLSGGVLRKPASLLVGNDDDELDEINPATGRFTDNPGIISNIDSFKLHGWGWRVNTEHNVHTYADCNIWNITLDEVKARDTSTRLCSNWGNPLGQIYLETLRYIAGAEEPTADFISIPDGAILPEGVTRVEAWDDPFSVENWCATCSVVVLSTGLNSFDGFESGYASVSDIKVNNNGTSTALSLADVKNSLNEIGNTEFPATFTGSYLSGGGADNRCTPKALSNLSDAEGVCPELPGQDGSYAIGGLAYLARTMDLRPDITNHADLRDNSNVKGISVNTYGINLAENIPSFEIPVGDNSVTLLPYCDTVPRENTTKNDDDYWPCSFLDVEVEFIRRDSNGRVVSGSYLIWWEDAQFGSDYDEDVAERLKFCVGSECASSDTVSYRGSEVTLSEFFTCPTVDAEDKSYVRDPAEGGDATDASDGCTDNVSSGQVKVMVTMPVLGPGNDYRVGYTITGTQDGVADGVAGIATRRSEQRANYPLMADEGSISAAVGRSATVFTAGTAGAKMLEKPLYYAAKYGSFSETEEDAQDPVYGGTPQHSSGDNRKWDSQDMFGNEGSDGTPDNYFNVSNPALLEVSLERVFESVIGGIASGSAAASNATRLEAGAVVYQARFSSIDWSGELRAFGLESGGRLTEEPLWSTDQPGKIRAPAQRRIYSSNGEHGIDFNWEQLSESQQVELIGGADEAVAKQRMEWIRGANVAGMRERRDGRVLGDIINSAPVFAGNEGQRFERLPAALGGDAYLTYVSNTKRERKPVVYVNANDGMLHAFDAESGEELFTYIPSMVYDKLRRLTMPNHGSPSNLKEYVVDGPLFVADAYLNGQWRNLLVGTLGAGGRGVFVLDVTNPDAITPNNLVLFELTEDDYSEELGYVLGEPVIAPVGDRWKLIFGNGYNSDNERAHLFVIDLEEAAAGNVKGSRSTVIATNEQGANGLAAPSLVVNNAGMVTAGYAGDLHGNIWKFDLVEGQLDYRLYTARDDAGRAQPITSAPVLGLNRQKPDGTIMVYFGTGKYLENADLLVGAGEPIQSFYALADEGATIGALDPVRDTSLHRKRIVSEEGGVRTVDGEREEGEGAFAGQIVSAMDWVRYDGWFLDFSLGEKVISKPLLITDRLIFPTLIPSEKSCDMGGGGWLMELVAVGDRHITHSVLAEGSVLLDDAVLGLSSPVRSGSDGYLPISDITGNLYTESIEFPPGVFGRQSWRQLQ